MAVSMAALSILVALSCAASCNAKQILHAHKSRQHVLNSNESKPMVPKIIHQSWKDEHVPERFLKWQESWKRTHPDWEYMFWTDAENRELVAKYYPWFLDTYDFLPYPIMKADSVRLLYMHLFGGDGPYVQNWFRLKMKKHRPASCFSKTFGGGPRILASWEAVLEGMYADLDYEAVRNMESLLQGHSVYLADMNSEKAELGLQQLVPNAWMASVPRHQFWLVCLQRVIKNAGYLEGYMDAERDMDKNMTGRMVPIAEHITGPGCIAEGLEHYEKLGGKGVYIIPAKRMYPFHWLMNDLEAGGTEEYDVCDVRHERFDDEACKKLFPEAYAITYWTHSWG